MRVVNEREEKAAYYAERDGKTFVNDIVGTHKVAFIIRSTIFGTDGYLASFGEQRSSITNAPHEALEFATWDAAQDVIASHFHEYHAIVRAVRVPNYRR